MLKALAIVIIILLASLSATTYSQSTGWSLTVQTDKPYYYIGETVNVNGRLTYNGGPRQSLSVAIVVRLLGSTGPPYYVGTSTTDQDGAYYDCFHLGGPSAVPGEYIVNVTAPIPGGGLVSNWATFQLVVSNDLSIVDLEPIQVVPDRNTLVLNKITALRVDVISTFSSNVTVPYIDVYYDFGNHYREQGENRNGLVIAPGLNRIYTPGGPIYTKQASGWQRSKLAWSPYHAGTGFDWNFFLKWTATGTDNNIRAVISTVPGETDPTNNEKTVTRKVVDTKDLSVLFVPINYTGDPVNLQFADSDRTAVDQQIASWLDFAYSAYPISTYHGFTMWPPQAASLPGEKPPGRIWENQDQWEHDKLAELANAWMETAEQWGYDRVVLLFKDLSRFLLGNPPGDGEAIGAGQSNQVPIVLEIGGGPRAVEALAHELGHTFFLWHPHDRGPNVFSATRYWVEKRDYEVATNTLMSYRMGNTLDINGNLFPVEWIDEGRYDGNSKEWTEAGTVLNEPGDPLVNPAKPASQETVASGFWSWNLLDQCKTGSDPKVLLLDGILYADGTFGADDSWFVLNGTSNLGEGNSGNYSIVLRDVNNQILDQFYFNCSCTYDEEVAGQYVAISAGSVPFVYEVPFNEATNCVQIVNASGNVIYSRNLTAHAPEVSIVRPSGNENLTRGEPYLISWNGSDLDGDSISYSLAYSEDSGKNWNPLAIEPNQTSYMWDTSDLDRGSTYLVKVIATDGVNVGEAISDSTFTVKAHDVAAGNVELSKTVAFEGEPLAMNVTIANVGDFDEAVNTTIFLNTSAIGQSSLIIAAGDSDTENLVCNTTGFAYGNYTISAYAWPVPGETNIADNNFTGGWVVVSRVGDLTGGSANAWDFVPDGVVDGSDLSIVARCFGSWPAAQPPLIWNANCDVNNDGVVDGSDLAIVAKHFGEGGP